MRSKAISSPGLRLLPLLLLLLALPYRAGAQTAYNPEFLGNAAPAPRTGFSPKIFLDYFNQNSISGNDVELAVEPQYWIAGFSGNTAKDWLQFLVHVPVGYRSQDLGGTTSSSFSLGSIGVQAESFVNLASGKDAVWWFDNGLAVGLPTSTGVQGLRIGGNSFSVTWFQENYVRLGAWIFSVSPIALTYSFQDVATGVTPGLSMGVMNSAFGYEVSDVVTLGVTTAYLLGNLAGSNDGTGKTLGVTQRLYVGPAFCFSFPNDIALQASIMIDVYTQNTTRGQGVAVAFWHMF
ncbi:MAG: hypothetical protein WCK73_05910 [Deltaproteobacteria bacterium]